MNLPLTLTGTHAPPVAATQGGCFTRRQALDAGWSPRQVERRLAAGAWIRHTHQALVSSAAHATALTDVWAVALTWPDAVASHWTAAALHGFPLPSGQGRTIHATVPRNLRSTERITAYRLPVAPCDVLTVAGTDGPRVTARARTAVDCLRVADLDTGQRLLPWLVTRRVLTREALAAEVRDGCGRWGTPALLELLRRSAGEALSVAERRLHRALRLRGVAGWVANAEVRVGGRILAVVDLLFPRHRVVVEVDGWAAHGTLDAFQRDRDRQNALVNAGYVVLRFTWRDLVDREDDVVAQILEALSAAHRRRFSS
jgi:very-short-patch-repair endonuclease